MSKQAAVSLDQQLFLATAANDCARARALIAQGANVNARNAARLLGHESAMSIRDTSFLHALRLGHLDCADAMLPHADLSLVGVNGDSAAILAVMTKNSTWTARIDAQWQPALPNVWGRDALRSAACMDLVEAASFLSLQVHPDAEHPNTTSSFSYALSAGSDKLLDAILPALVAASTPERLSNCLLRCAADNRLSAAKFLLDNGAMPDSQFLEEAFRTNAPDMIDLAIGAISPLSVDAKGLDGFVLAVRSGAHCAILKTLRFFSPASEDALAELAEKISRLPSNNSATQNLAQARAWLDQLNLGLSTPQPTPEASRASRPLRV